MQGYFEDFKQEPDEDDSSKEENNPTYLEEKECAYVDLVENVEVYIDKDQPKEEFLEPKKRSCRICMTEVSKQFISLFAKLNGEYVAQMMTFCTTLEVNVLYFKFTLDEF